MVYQRRAQPRYRSGPARRLLLLAAAMLMVSTGQSFQDTRYAEVAAPEAAESIELRHKQQPA